MKHVCWFCHLLQSSIFTEGADDGGTTGWFILYFRCHVGRKGQETGLERSRKSTFHIQMAGSSEINTVNPASGPPGNLPFLTGDWFPHISWGGSRTHLLAGFTVII